MKEKEPTNKVEITTETKITSTSYYDNGGIIEKEITKTISNRVNLDGMSDEFLRDYFGLKTTIDWGNLGEPKERKDE